MRTRALVALAALLAGPARASFTDLGAGARAPGMGDAFTALADDAYAVHYNPAGLAQLERPQMAAAYAALYTGLSDGSSIGTSQLVYAHPWSRGKKGVWGFGWERFALSGLYQEQVLTGSYGRRLWYNEEGSQFMGGVNLKYLTHSFATPAEAANACSAGACGGAVGSDPILSGKNSKSVPDLDIGMVYRLPRRFQWGLSVQHLLQPDVGFGGSDKVARAINLGGAYRSLWLSLIGEIKQGVDGAGKSSRDLVFAAERYFPTLDYGQFGLRGSVGFGMNSSDWREMSMGGSYRINKIQFDYAFLLPIGAIEGQSGSHRVSLMYHFGAPTSDEEISKELLEEARHLKELGPDYGYEYAQELKPQSLEDPRLGEIRLLIEQRKYRLAHNRLVELAQKQPLSQALLRLSNRLDLVASYYADLPEPASKYDRQLVDGLRRFLFGQDRLSMLQVSYAFSMKPDEARLTHLLDEMEKAVGLKSTRLAGDHPRTFLDELLYQVEFSHTRGDEGRAETLLNDILVLEPTNPTALERLGSLRYLASRLQEAVQIWETALKTETREHEIESLKEYIRLANDRAAGKALPGQVAPLAPAPVAPKPEPSALPALPSSAAPAEGAPAPSAKTTKRGDPRDVQSLYQKGVEHYARGEYLQASAMFLRILQIDPENDQARKALDRIDRRWSRK